MDNQTKFRYYYPTYRQSINTYFRIKLGTIGHIMVQDKILCGEVMATKEKFTSYTIKCWAKPGYTLCQECVEKRSKLRKEKSTTTMSDQEKLKRWLKATMPPSGEETQIKPDDSTLTKLEKLNDSGQALLQTFGVLPVRLRMMKFNIWQSFNGRVWLMTRRRQLTARQAAEQLAEVIEAEIELQKTAPGKAEYEIRPDLSRGG